MQEYNQEEFSEIVKHARGVFRSGRTLPIPWRKKQLKGLARFLDDHASDIEQTLKEDIGKCSFESSIYEIGSSHTEITSAYVNLDKWAKPEVVKPDLMQRPQPYGVCLIIGTWNYPIAMIIHPLVGAIAAGNCAVVKPSEVAPKTAELFAQYLNDYIDKECFPVLVTGPQGSATLVNENRFDMIAYTGSGNVGKLIMAAASKHLTPVLLELGGKNPCIIDKNCDLKLAAKRIAWAAYVNAGQICITPDHVICHHTQQKELVEQLIKTVEKYYGKDPKSSPDYARIINKRHWNRLMKLMGSGKIAHGGDANEEDNYIAPTILTDVAESSDIMQEEVFGPILPILTVRNIDEALAMVHRSPAKPLALYLFSKDRNVIDKVVQNTTSGGVSINDCMMQFNEHQPFGGIGDSGMGNYHGKFSFDTFSHKRATYDSGIPDFLLSMRYPPYTKKNLKDAKKFICKRIPDESSMFKRILALVALGALIAYVFKFFGN